MSLEVKIKRLFHRACADYSLLEDGDRVLVAVSGGKDSLALARLMAEQSRIYKPRIEVAAAHVIMDNIPYETDRTYLETFCQSAGIPLHILHSTFDESTDHRKTKCFLCSWNRRKTLFTYARDNGYNKVALGHHMDDFLITMLMNMTFEGTSSSMLPSMSMKHYPITLIRPLCLVHETMLTEMAEKECFARQKTPCPYEEITQRAHIADVFHKLETLNPEARYSLWRVLTNNNTPNADEIQINPQPRQV